MVGLDLQSTALSTVVEWRKGYGVDAILSVNTMDVLMWII